MTEFEFRTRRRWLGGGYDVLECDALAPAVCGPPIAWFRKLAHAEMFAAILQAGQQCPRCAALPVGKAASWPDCRCPHN